MTASRSDIRAYGSFKDGLRAPIHRWFTYPAGYSHRLVNEMIRHYQLTDEHWIGDPFVGTGTTSIAAKEAGVNSLGVEAHPFVWWVARTKLYDGYDLEALYQDALETEAQARSLYEGGLSCEGVWPALVYKCFDSDVLARLYALRIIVLERDARSEHRDFLALSPDGDTSGCYLGGCGMAVHRAQQVR